MLRRCRPRRSPILLPTLPPLGSLWGLTCPRSPLGTSLARDRLRAPVCPVCSRACGGRVNVVTHLCHAPWPRCRVTPRSRRARYDGTAGIAPRGTGVAHITNCMQSKCSLDNLGNAIGTLESGMYTSRQAPRGRPCRASSSRGEGRLRRWSDDYRALGAIWARTWRRCHGNKSVTCTRAATQDPSGNCVTSANWCSTIKHTIL